MALPISVEKIRTGLYRLVWHMHTVSTGKNYISDKVDLSSFGIDECYQITYRGGCRSGPYLLLTLHTIDRNTDFKQRKVVARSLGYKHEMFFTAQNTSYYSKGIKCQKEGDLIQTTGQQEDRQEETHWYNWRAEWTDITRKDCSICQSSQCTAEYFEILIDMDPKNCFSQAQRSVLSNFSHLWESKTLADVTFRFDDKDIEAHKCIVSCGSPVLAAMFRNEFKEKQARIVEIKETESDVFEKLLHFLYTGKLDLQFNDMSALYLAADMYNIVGLKKECEKYLLENVTLENATTNLIISHLNNAEKLYNATLRYMQQNSEAICSRPDWMTVIKNYPELGFAAMQFMVKKTVDQESKEEKKVKTTIVARWYLFLCDYFNQKALKKVGRFSYICIRHILSFSLSLCRYYNRANTKLY